MSIRMMVSSLLTASAMFVAGAWPAVAEENWTYPVYDFKPPREDATVHAALPALSTYSAVGAVNGKHQLCLLLPQTQDAVFIAYIYGAIEEARRLGQAITVFDAGGYDHDADQRAQFENCVTLGVDAIILQPISPTGWEADLASAKDAGIKVINVTEGLASPVDGRSLVDFRVNGGLLGELIAKDHPAGGKEAIALVLPGGAGIPFVEDTVTGFKEKVAGSSIKVADVIYADMTETAQLKVVEDALVAYPDVDYIIGNAMAVKQAVNVLAQRGMTGKVKLLATYLDPDVVAAIDDGKVFAGTAESSVMLKKIAVNLAVAAVEGSTTAHDIVPQVGLVTQENAKDATIRENNFPPENWEAVFKLD